MSSSCLSQLWRYSCHWASTISSSAEEVSIMLRRRYEILLPLRHNDGRLVSDDQLNQTREELVEQFDGVSVQPQSEQTIARSKQRLASESAGNPPGWAKSALVREVAAYPS